VTDVRAEIRVRGRVQGVSFRAYARAEAMRLQLRGWVRNEDDGSVAAVAEGPAADVDAFVAWCGHGPPAASVTGVEVTRGSVVGEVAPFSIRR
jgi:acylphosphatase